jgi:serine phosphatase RsbU (regulator of sigma subunit)
LTVMENLSPEQLLSEKQKLDELRMELELKNKQMWSMSETVYREKKKADEQLDEILNQKSELEAQKKENDEKVKMLWEQSTAIHVEKERINKLKEEVEHRHKEVMDSVTYAKRIQEAILPDKNEITDHLPESFILFKPRDIVSGDFYWFSHKNNMSYIAAVDCTGHGVPGAFMSMIGNTLLNQIVKEKGVTDPGEILHALNDGVNYSLKQKQKDSESRDGMDMGMCCFDLESMELRYAGDMRPLYVVKDDALEEFKADKFPIGGREYDVPKKFTTQVFQLQKGNTVYMSTDGYADQFSPTDKKLMTKKFKEIILSVQHKSMPEQKEHLDKFVTDWKGNMEQTDDILVIGVRL